MRALHVRRSVRERFSDRESLLPAFRLRQRLPGVMSAAHAEIATRARSLSLDADTAAPSEKRIRTSPSSPVPETGESRRLRPH